MDKEKQIEEMAKEIECAKQRIWSEETPRNEDEDYLWHSRRIAEYLTKLGYRKIPENARVFIPDEQMVLLSREEAERFRGQTINIAKIKAQERNETAEKILAIIGNMIDECDDRFKLKDYQWHKDLCRQYGVEIKE